MSESQPIQNPKRRGIYLLPNLFTVGSLFAGFYAIVAGTKHHFEVAAIAIFISMLLDGIDGRIARLLGSQSEFGAQMDSLSDMVCFGLSPALVMYSWSLSAIGKPGWLAAFIYAVCAALRLARFNSQSQSENKRYFQGLSTTAAAGFIASMILAVESYQITGLMLGWPMAIIIVFVALLQISTIRYRSFKDIDLRSKVSFLTIFALVLVLVLITIDPPDVLFIMFLIYILSGPMITIWQLRRWRHVKANNHKQKSENK